MSAQIHQPPAQGYRESVKLIVKLAGSLVWKPLSTGVLTVLISLLAACTAAPDPNSSSTVTTSEISLTTSEISLGNEQSSSTAFSASSIDATLPSSMPTSSQDAASSEGNPSSTESSSNSPAFTWAPATLEILNTTHDQWMRATFVHQGRFDDVLRSITFLLDSGDIGDERLHLLFDYISIVFSNTLTDNQALELSRLLLNIAAHEDFYTQSSVGNALKISYLKAVRRHMTLTGMEQEFSLHQEVLSALYTYFIEQENIYSEPSDEMAVSALVNAHSQLHYDAYFDAPFRERLLQAEELFENAVSFAKSDAARTRDNPVGLKPIFDILRYRYWLFHKDSAGIDATNTEQQAQLDLVVSDIATAHLDKPSPSRARRNVYYYLSNTTRGADACTTTFAEVCELPPTATTIEETFDGKITCSNGVVVFTQNYNALEQQAICEEITYTETQFFSLMQTTGEPVENDDNAPAYLYAFDGQQEYQRLGGPLFNINTNNGGLFIEGIPTDPNSASIGYLYRNYFGGGDLVYGLDHEYTHYLDNRYNIFGLFPFDQPTVWWAEGLADYLKYGSENPRIKSVLWDGPELTLTEIFATRYTDDGVRIYQWGYLGMRFFLEEMPDVVMQLRQYLRAGDFTAFGNQLDTLASQNQANFEAWLDKTYIRY